MMIIEEGKKLLDKLEISSIILTETGLYLQSNYYQFLKKSANDSDLNFEMLRSKGFGNLNNE